KGAVSFIFDFEASVARHARERGMAGVICGHIHAAAMRDVDGVMYINCGDWVDSCTAVVEHVDGSMELIAWGSSAARLEGAETEAGEANEAGSVHSEEGGGGWQNATHGRPQN